MSVGNEEFINVCKNGKEFCYKSSEPDKLLCRNCHAPIYEDMTRCPNCNNNLVEQKTVANNEKPDWYNNGNDSNSNYYNSEDDTPISMWGYFGYEILFALPIVGWLILIVMAISAKNTNVKNFARSYFCLLIVIFVLFAMGAGSIFSIFR